MSQDKQDLSKAVGFCYPTVNKKVFKNMIAVAWTQKNIQLDSLNVLSFSSNMEEICMGLLFVVYTVIEKNLIHKWL